MNAPALVAFALLGLQGSQAINRDWQLGEGERALAAAAQGHDAPRAPR